MVFPVEFWILNLKEMQSIFLKIGQNSHITE